VEITCTRAEFVMMLHVSGVRSGLLSSNASLSMITVQSEFAFSLLSYTPEKNILSFSNLNGIIPNESMLFPDSLPI